MCIYMCCSVCWKNDPLVMKALLSKSAVFVGPG